MTDVSRSCIDCATGGCKKPGQMHQPDFCPSAMLSPDERGAWLLPTSILTCRLSRLPTRLPHAAVGRVCAASRRSWTSRDALGIARSASPTAAPCRPWRWAWRFGAGRAQGALALQWGTLRLRYGMRGAALFYRVVRFEIDASVRGGWHADDQPELPRLARSGRR